MSVFDKMFKKKSTTLSEMVLPQPMETGYLGNAEQLANAVAIGLQNDDYSGLNQQLTNLRPLQQERIEYVFEHPSVSYAFISIALCFLASCGFVYYLLIGIGTIAFSEKFFSLGAIIGVGSFVVLLLNTFLIKRLVSRIKYKRRFDIYSDILGFKMIEYVEDIALCSNQKEITVLKDLNRAIKQKLIPQGHFSRDNLVLMVSDDVYNNYIEKPALYDRFFEKQLEERHRKKSRTKRISQVMESGEKYIKKLNDFQSLVKEKSVSNNIKRLSNVVSMIFHEIDVNPKSVNSLGVFLNYYLPTTEKLIDTYITLGEKNTTSKNAMTARKEIENSLNTIICSYEMILEKLYEEYEMETSSSVEAMELVMKKEGLSV